MCWCWELLPNIQMSTFNTYKCQSNKSLHHSFKNMTFDKNDSNGSIYTEMGNEKRHVAFKTIYCKRINKPNSDIANDPTLRTTEIALTTDLIHFSGWWLWCQICQHKDTVHLLNALKTITKWKLIGMEDSTLGLYFHGTKTNDMHIGMLEYIKNQLWKYEISKKDYSKIACTHPQQNVIGSIPRSHPRQH